MEKIQQQEKLPITKEQIKEFIGLYKKFSGKGKTVIIGPGETKTTFKSFEKDGKMCINAKNVLMDATRTYNPEKETISVFYDDTDTLGRVLAEDGELDQKNLDHDLEWFHNCVPSLKEKISKKHQERIGNIFTDK